MNLKCMVGIAIVGLTSSLFAAEDITTLDGHKYEDIRGATLKSAGLFFIVGTGSSIKGVTIPYTNLSDTTKDKYHYDPFEVSFAQARQNQTVNLRKNLAYSLDNLDAAKKKAIEEKKLIGFIMVWDSFFEPSQPMGRGSSCGLAHFYDAFQGNMVLVFVRHESELDKVPDSVKLGFQGPEEGGFAPNMAVVTADCSRFLCEIPYGGEQSNGQIREQIFRKKVAMIRKIQKEAAEMK